MIQAGATLPALARWYCQQMADLIAPLSRRLRRGRDDGLILQCDPSDPGAWPLSRRAKGGLIRLGILHQTDGDAVWTGILKQRRRGEPVHLSLARPFLQREVLLPEAARADLADMLRYEMDLLTPFAAAELLYTCHEQPHRTDSAQIRVLLTLVPRQWLAPLLDRLARLEIAPAAVEATGGQVIPLVSGQRSRARRRTLMTLGLAAGALLLATPVLRQAIALDAAETQLAARRPALQEVDRLSRRHAADAATARAVSQARSQATAVLGVLARLTDAVPDDAFLTGLSLVHGQLGLDGRAASASRLITLLSEAALREPGFTAPVMRAEDGRESFSLQATAFPP